MVEVSSDTSCQLAPQQGGMSCADARGAARLVPDAPKIPMLSRGDCAALQGEYARLRDAWRGEVAALYGNAG
jgi:hypothetical protein